MSPRWSGSIGMPLLEVLDPPQAPEFWAIELSSYETGDVAASGAHPQVAVVLNVFPEHRPSDRHGCTNRYVANLGAGDRSRAWRYPPCSAPMTHASRSSAMLQAKTKGIDVRWFVDRSGWHPA